MKPHKRWKMLVRKLEYLRLELDETKESYEKYEAEFAQQVQKIEQPESVEVAVPAKPEETSKEVTVRVPDEVIYEDEKKQEQPDVPMDDLREDDRPEPLRKLWKLIAAKTHPDVTKGNYELTELYKTANEAWRKLEIEILLDVAAELKIDVPDPDPKLVKMLQERCSKLEDEIKKMTQSPLWEWGNADEEFRDMMIQGVISRRAERRKK